MASNIDIPLAKTCHHSAIQVINFLALTEPQKMHLTENQLPNCILSSSMETCALLRLFFLIASPHQGINRIYLHFFHYFHTPFVKRISRSVSFQQQRIDRTAKDLSKPNAIHHRAKRETKPSLFCHSQKSFSQVAISSNRGVNFLPMSKRRSNHYVFTRTDRGERKHQKSMMRKLENLNTKQMTFQMQAM